MSKRHHVNTRSGSDRITGLRLVQHAAEAFVREAPKFARQLATADSQAAYRSAVVEYLMSVFGEGEVGSWLATVRWQYGGFHITTDLLTEFVSVLFSPTDPAVLGRLGAPTPHGNTGRRPSKHTVDSEDEMFVSIDLTVAPDGRVFLIEVNGSNAVGTSLSTGSDSIRAWHMCKVFRKRWPVPTPCVVLFAYQPGFWFPAEFCVGRAAPFARRVQHGYQTWIRSASEELGPEELSIVCGSVAEIAQHVKRAGESLVYRGREVVFITNPNLFPELSRRGVIERRGEWYDVPDNLLHDGRFAWISQARGTQQDIAASVGFAQLRHTAVGTEEEFTSAIRGFQKSGITAVAKMNAGSGGCGIEFLPPDMSDDAVVDSYHRLVRAATAKYGSDTLKTLFPIRILEFAQSSPLQLPDGPHLWEMRLQCLVYGGQCQVLPCFIRLCPAAFDGRHYVKEAVMTNSAGLVPVPGQLRSPFDESVLREIGIGPSKMSQIEELCARWCESAWRHDALVAGLTTKSAEPKTLRSETEGGPEGHGSFRNDL